MSAADPVQRFLSSYSEDIQQRAEATRLLLLKNLPGIIEQVDLPAKMIAYCYGQKYSELVCTLFPSKKGLKLGFARGVDLPDPEKTLQGKGKISRYIEIDSIAQLKSPAINTLLLEALAYYRVLNKKS